MLTDLEEKCLMVFANDAEKATYTRLKARLRNLMPGDKGKAYRTLQSLTAEISYPELVVALAELAILDGRVKWGSSLISHLEGQHSTGDQA